MSFPSLQDMESVDDLGGDIYEDGRVRSRRGRGMIYP